MMKKRIVALTLALTTLSTSAFAEQEKAIEYRKILDSGKFFVEYELDYGKKILVAENGKRMDSMIFSKSGNMALGIGLSLINPFLAIASLLVKNDSITPSTLYQDGKYYQFQGKKRAIMAYWNQLNDTNLNPNENWSGVKYRLCIPEELSALSVNDPFYQELFGGTKPSFVASGNASVDGKECVYDKYRIPTYSAAGSVLFDKYYYYYYFNGELKKIYTYMSSDGETESLVRTLKINKLQAEIPDNALKIPNGCKVYAAGIGDMNDLIEEPVLVESYEKKEAKE